MIHTKKFLSPEQLEAVRKNRPASIYYNPFLHQTEMETFARYIDGLAYGEGLSEIKGHYGLDTVSGEFLEAEEGD